MRTLPIVAAALLAAVGAASADDFAGPYIGVGITAQTKIGDENGDSYKPAVAAFGGYNWQNGPVVLGLEAHARFDTNWRTSSEYRDGTVFHKSETKIGASGDVRLRVGYAVNNTMIYGRAGGGIARSDFRSFFRNTLPWGTFESRRRDHKSGKFLSLGAGVERNVGRMFVRGDVGLRRFLSVDNGDQYEASAAFGVRF